PVRCDDHQRNPCFRGRAERAIPASPGHSSNTAGSLRDRMNSSNPPVVIPARVTAALEESRAFSSESQPGNSGFLGRQPRAGMRVPEWIAGYVGLPFRSLGRDRDGLDCWGLVHLVYREVFRLEVPAYSEDYVTAYDCREIGELIRR